MHGARGRDRVVGHGKNGLIRGFDVDAGVETFTRRTPCASPVSAVAIGGGWIVAGTDGGAVVTMSAVDGTDVVVSAGMRVCAIGKSEVRSPAGWARAGFRGGSFAPTRRLGSNAASPRAPSIRAVDSPPSPPAPRS